MLIHLKFVASLLSISSLIYLCYFLSRRPLLSYIYHAHPVHVLVVSSWRSGSSFIGQVFNHHSDVFYLFEPGHPVWMKFKNESSELLHYPLRDLILSLFTCDVSPLQQFLPNGGKHFDDLHFFAETQALCKPPTCSASPLKAVITSEGYDRQNCFQRCKNTPMIKMAEACRTYSHVVMKTVRILDLSVLLPLLRDPALDLRIIHLVRDPRAIALSKKFFPFLTDEKIVLKNEEKDKNDSNREIQVMAKVCRSQVAINKVAMTSQDFHGRYMAIRLEDLSSKPAESVKEIYAFSGLSITNDLQQWIYNVTHEKRQDKGRFLSFTNISSKVDQKWRMGLDFNIVKQIQESCKDAMDVFGYLPVASQNEQKNMTVILTNSQWQQSKTQVNQMWYK